jgi:hypothetical protein
VQRMLTAIESEVPDVCYTDLGLELHADVALSSAPP